MAQKPRDRERTSKNETLKLVLKSLTRRIRLGEGANRGAQLPPQKTRETQCQVPDRCRRIGRWWHRQKRRGCERTWLVDMPGGVSVQLNQSPKSSVPRSSNFSES